MTVISTRIDDFIVNKLGASSFELLQEIEVLWSGWEADDKAWLVKTDVGEQWLIITNHGSPAVANSQWIKSKLAEYATASTQLIGASQFLAQNSTP